MADERDAFRFLDDLRPKEYGELLFEFTRLGDGARFRCELIDHAEIGCEVHFFRDGEFIVSRMFTRRSRDPDRDLRALAIGWAIYERRLFQADQ
jgi:hypothetical protein